MCFILFFYMNYACNWAVDMKSMRNMADYKFRNKSSQGIKKQNEIQIIKQRNIKWLAIIWLNDREG